VISLTAYPEDTLEGLIARNFVQMIAEIEDHAIDLESIQFVIDESRALMREAGWPRAYDRHFLSRLRDDLTTLTRGHPVTRQFVELLTIEVEFN
jgi:hypothetical protein